MQYRKCVSLFTVLLLYGWYATVSKVVRSCSVRTQSQIVAVFRGEADTPKIDNRRLRIAIGSERRVPPKTQLDLLYHLCMNVLQVWGRFELVALLTSRMRDEEGRHD